MSFNIHNSKRPRYEDESTSDSEGDHTVDEAPLPWNPDPNRQECILVPGAPKVHGRYKNHSFKIISTWNFKGGVGKTTTAFSLGYALATQGKKVLFVDADPQMNLTEAALSFKISGNEQAQHDDDDTFTRLQKLGPADNLYDSLKKIVHGGEITPASVVDLIMVDPGTPEEQESSGMNDEVQNTAGRLFLLPGSMDIAEFDENISAGMNANPDGYGASTMNFPGAFYDLIKKTAQFHRIDYVVVDLSPAVGHLNRAILFSSHVFMMPCRCDAFSRQAVRVLTAKLPGWYKAYNEFREETKQFPWIKCPIPEHEVKFAGIVTVGFDYTADYKPNGRATNTTLRKLRDAMTEFLRVLPESMITAVDRAGLIHPPSLEIAQFPNFNQLGLLAQRACIPPAYLPNRYLQNYNGGRWKRLAKKMMAISKANRARQRQMIEQVAQHLLAVLDDDDA